MENVPFLPPFMMPWEHVFVGYVTVSLLAHAVYRTAPTTAGTLVVVLASLLPDLVDKPLAWGAGVFTSGYAVGHSVLVGLPVVLAVGWLARGQGRPQDGLALAVGYLLHLMGDVLPSYLFDGEVRIGRVLWPVSGGGQGYENGFVGELTVNLVEYGAWVSGQLTAGTPNASLLVVLGLALAGTLLWLYDGMPIGREILAALGRAGRAVVRAVRG